MDVTGRNRNSREERKLFLFCSHSLAREQFGRLLESGDLRVVACPELRLPPHESEAFDADQPCLAVVDAGNIVASLEFVRLLRLEQRSAYVLALLPALEESVTFPLLRLGVRGLLSYRQAEAELARAAMQVADGGYWVPREVLTRFVESILPELQQGKSLESETGISRRERDVLDLLLDNLSNKEIAARLFVSERTVKFHVSNLLSKFGVQRRADLIVLWMQRSHPAVPLLPHELGKAVSAQVN